MLAHHGIAAVWQLQVAAAIVYRTGNRTAAECILEMADAALYKAKHSGRNRVILAEAPQSPVRVVA